MCWPVKVLFGGRRTSGTASFFDFLILSWPERDQRSQLAKEHRHPASHNQLRNNVIDIARRRNICRHYVDAGVVTTWSTRPLHVWLPEGLNVKVFARAVCVSRPRGDMTLTRGSFTYASGEEYHGEWKEGQTSISVSFQWYPLVWVRLEIVTLSKPLSFIIVKKWLCWRGWYADWNRMSIDSASEFNWWH